MVTLYAISKSIKKSISSYYGLTDNFIQTIYNGVPFCLFSSNKPLEERAYDFVLLEDLLKLKIQILYFYLLLIFVNLIQNHR